jgi:TetR/AcrR family transcriptional regulator, fatty acid metabolism regulator protein
VGQTKRQEEIVEAAIAIIAEEGIQELTVKRLATRIGVTEPALYRHFDSKLEILSAILDHFSEWNVESLSATAAADLSPGEKVRRVVVDHTSRFSENPAVSGVLFAEEIFRNEGSLSRKMAEMMARAHRHLTAILSEGIETGEFRRDASPEQLSLICLGALRLLVTRWRLDHYGFDLKAEGELLGNTLIALLRAPS